MIELLDEHELPTTFAYPEEFLTIVKQGLIDFEPWVIMHGEYLKMRNNGLKNRYKDRILIPFARRLDNDDIACWDVVSPIKVFIIHDFASEGWEKKEEVESFWQWFRKIIDDMIEYNKGNSNVSE